MYLPFTAVYISYLSRSVAVGQFFPFLRSYERLFLQLLELIEPYQLRKRSCLGAFFAQSPGLASSAFIHWNVQWRAGLPLARLFHLVFNGRFGSVANWIRTFTDIWWFLLLHHTRLFQDRTYAAPRESEPSIAQPVLELGPWRIAAYESKKWWHRSDWGRSTCFIDPT